MEKRKKLALQGENMPDHIYKLLDEKAEKRSLTPYVVEAVEYKLKYEELLKEMFQEIQSIKSMLAAGAQVTYSAPKEPKLEVKVGKIIDAKEVRNNGVIDDHETDF